MRRITITLSDEEYAALEARAEQDRRTPREMAARLVTQPPTFQYVPTPMPIGPAPWNPIWPGNVWCSGSTDATKINPNGTTIWNGPDA